MTRSKPLALAACAAALLTGVAVAHGDTTQAGAQDLTFKVPSLRSSFVDTGAKGPSTGDYVVDTGTVVDAGSGVRRGTVIDTCILARVGKHDGYNCHGGARLPGGMLTMALMGVTSERVSTFAVTGGTGTYAGARGTLVTTPLGRAENSPTRIDVHLLG